MIDGFTDEPSAFPGDQVVVRVATDAPEFRFEVHRQGATLVHCHSSAWIDGAGFRGEAHVPWDDWSRPGTRPDGQPAAGWNGVTLDVPVTWSSGVYVLSFVEGDGHGRAREPLPDLGTPDARSGKALLVLKSPAPGATSQLLYKLPLFTYQAYNTAGGNCVYQRVDVSLRRPGGGTGGTPWDCDTRWVDKPNLDPWDLASPRQTFAHWDAKLIAWLEREGYRVDYCTDWDVHRPDAPTLLAPYALVLSVGHDEYFSAPMRAHLEAFVAAGGNLAFLSGNTCWWRAELDGAEPYRLRGQQSIRRWSDAEVGQPEDSLTGVSFRHGGEGDHERVAIGYTVQHTHTWPFEGTGLTDGDVLGEADALVGYECDGAPYDKQAGRPVRARFDPEDGTPPGFVILATADVAAFTNQGNRGATMGMFRRGDGGTVWTAATTDWPRVAASGDARVGRITRNVLDRLGGAPKRVVRLALVDHAIACDGLFEPGADVPAEPDPGEVHAIVGARDGSVHYLSTASDVAPARDSRIMTIAGLVDLAGCGSDAAGRRCVLVCSDSGDVVELSFARSTPRELERVHLGHFEGAFRVAGSGSGHGRDERVALAIVASRRGQVYAFALRSATRAILRIGDFADVVDVAACHDPRDQHAHIIVGQADGSITALELNPRADVVLRRTSLGRFPGLTGLSAYCRPGDAFFPRRVVLSTADGLLHELRYGTDLVRSVLFRTPGNGLARLAFARDSMIFLPSPI